MATTRFAGFELDDERAELRGPDGAPIRLRPKTFEMLRLFAANPSRVLSKQELMEAVWPNVHVGEDGLFQCIREIRAALGDEQRQVIKLVSGRGYLFVPAVEEDAARTPPLQPATPRGRWLSPGRLVLIAAVVAVAGVAAIAAANLVAPSPPTIAVMPIVDTSTVGDGGSLAAGVTDELVDGLARIDNLRVLAPGAGAPAQFEVRGELLRTASTWTLKLRAVRTATGVVESVATASVDPGLAPDLQEVRLAAGAGDRLARWLNEALEGSHAGAPEPTPGVRVAIEQASASINQTSRERFGVAQLMLKTALASSPDNVDLQVALAALQTRGIQMVWYDEAEAAAARANGEAMLKRAVALRPRSIAVLEAQCRFLAATNEFVESLIACARATSFDPWNGSALYQTGLAQVFLGRFEDALISFEQAYRYDTPTVSRWTWLLGIGWVNVLLGRDAEAALWLERSIAVTPASGRTHLMLATAYQRLGRATDARAAFAAGMLLRPGSTAANVEPPARNVSPAFLEASARVMSVLVELGLPER
ncbi:transcriptional regulator CadC [Devosia insulae DS-56]|uniref:Transcriptional regulator CadC n=1 Tax=Devosia insulae DS-56 TaxID=1116389 RepID=A0A1E5XUM3_9HYPH|nr:winged helix-turn-helix domain-containing protein [Devosia insulae]OEO32307.1 transcriptional regulator CadC [Devosia insulae DS-56]